MNEWEIRVDNYGLYLVHLTCDTSELIEQDFFADEWECPDCCRRPPEKLIYRFNLLIEVADELL